MNRIAGALAIAVAISISMSLSGCKKEDTAAQPHESLEKAVRDVAANRFPAMKADNRKMIVDQLTKAGQAQMLEVTEIVSPVEMRLADGRVLRLAYLRAPESQAKREEAMTTLRTLCIDSNYVLMTASTANVEGYARNVLQDSHQRIVAIVTLHTGQFILADVGMFMLEEGLASIDPESGFEQNSLYKAEAEHLRQASLE